ncbi:MAG: RnfABCDGE type electron transport complex subunit G [Lachnospiraceae bacterium]|jgi:electron transport complex, RnfABCDGE type, G subunit|nr:RnfABCDGE type electron transport complex subunit G [Lachnospiraceae bacterium]
MANSENKQANTLIHDAIALFIITLVAGILLGAVYMITKDPIAKAEEEATNKAYAAVYKDAEFASDDTLTEAVKSFQGDVAAGKIDAAYTDVELIEARTASSGGSQAGYVVKVSGKGYGGAVTIALGITNEGEVLGIQILDASNETPGLGQNSTKEDWNGQYIGMTSDKTLSVVKDGSGSQDNGTINSISGATITSNAVTRAVNVALKFVASQQ